MSSGIGLRSAQKQRKRICLNLDGTWFSDTTKADDTKPHGQPSNPTRIGRATLLEDDDAGMEQIVYYHAGIGTGGNWLDAINGGAFGIGLNENVREAYGFLTNNYDYGDEIYITGWSRGAYTARSVAGLIGKVGILTKKGMDKFYDTLDCYEKNLPDVPVSEARGETRIHYRESADGDVKRIKIRAVGVWDTVGALGIPVTRSISASILQRIENLAFNDVSLGDQVENAFHAISLNEKRNIFSPTLWEHSTKLETTNFEQCWFPGDHTGVGGGLADTQTADLALAWMMSKFEKLGLKFDYTYLYNQYLKYKESLKAIPHPPRYWAEGKISLGHLDLFQWYSLGGESFRTPMQYQRTEGQKLVSSGVLLQNTNETIHPSVRYRTFRTPNKGMNLGPDDRGSYDPGAGALKGWSAPKACDDGRVGDTPTATAGPNTVMKWTKGSLELPESELGYYEKVLLTLYDSDPATKGAWKGVVGTNGPPDEIKNAVAQVISSNP